jgi:hypothetical protein
MTRCDVTHGVWHTSHAQALLLLLLCCQQEHTKHAAIHANTRLPYVIVPVSKHMMCVMRQNTMYALTLRVQCLGRECFIYGVTTAELQRLHDTHAPLFLRMP